MSRSEMGVSAEPEAVLRWGSDFWRSRFRRARVRGSIVQLAMRCWEQVRERMENLGKGLDEKIIHHDLDSVYTSYRWLRAILLDDEMRISYSESGARGNPWIESLWGRTKAEVGSRITEASSLPALRTVFDERFRY